MTWSPGRRRIPPGIRVAHNSIKLVALISNLTLKVFGNDIAKQRGESDIEDDTLPEEGLDFVITFARNKTSFSINLSEFTTEELDAFVTSVNFAVNEARPVTELRDKIAKEAADNGDSVYYRSLRAAPKVSILKRRTAGDDEGVQV
jgi:DNA gyrase/topoisomerase IV subunit A